MTEARRFLTHLLLLCLGGLFVHSEYVLGPPTAGMCAHAQTTTDVQTGDADWENFAEGKKVAPKYGRVPLPTSLEGKKLLLVWNGKHNSDRLLRCFAILLRRVLPDQILLPASNTVLFSPIAQNIGEAKNAVDEMRGLKPDLVVLATGDCRVCAAWLAVEGVLLEKAGIPTVAVVTRPFYKTYEKVCRNMRMQPLICVVVRHPVAAISQEQVDERGREFFEEFCKLFQTLARYSSKADVHGNAVRLSFSLLVEESTP